jgi:cytochrome b6-f complex iron-sulfur subunit
MMDTHLVTSINKKVVLPLSRRLVAFYGEFIVINKKKQVTVFSAHCTHLGCLINQMENDRLVCPCHGSEFDLEGNAVKGPAYKPLKSYACKESADKQQLTVQTGEA